MVTMEMKMVNVENIKHDFWNFLGNFQRPEKFIESNQEKFNLFKKIKNFR
jgi:hypothetical protein